MKEVDALSRLSAEVERMDKFERQLRIVEPDLQRLLRETRGMNLIVPKNLLDFENVTLHSKTSGLIEEMQRSFREAERLRSIGIADAVLEARSQMDRHTEAMFGSVHAASQMANLHFGLQLQTHWSAVEKLNLHSAKWLEDIQSASVRMAEIARTTFAIPETALLHWPGKVLVARAPLLEDCVLNTAALERFHVAEITSDAIAFPKRLALATDFVFEHAETVRRLPPQLPQPEGAEREEVKGQRSEEIGGRLELALGAIDARLVSLRTRAWSNLAGGDIAGARLAMAGIRELFDEILRMFAPDEVVAATPEWKNRTDPELLKLRKPTRRARVAYVLGEATVTELDSLYQFEKSIRRMQGYVHAFASDPELVRAAMTSMEVWIHFLVHYGRLRSR